MVSVYSGGEAETYLYRARETTRCKDPRFFLPASYAEVDGGYVRVYPALRRLAFKSEAVLADSNRPDGLGETQNGSYASDLLMSWNRRLGTRSADSVPNIPLPIACSRGFDEPWLPKRPPMRAWISSTGNVGCAARVARAGVRAAYADALLSFEELCGSLVGARLDRERSR